MNITISTDGNPSSAHLLSLASSAAESTGNSGGFPIGTVLFWAFAIMVTILIVKARATYVKEVKEQISKNLKAAGFVSSTHSLIGTKLLAIDKDSRRIAIHVTGPKGETKFLDADQIMSVSVYEGGFVTSQTNRGRQIGAAAVGGAVFGKTGAIIGAIGSKSKQQEKIKDVTVRLELDDNSCPIYDHKIFSGETNKDGWMHRQESEKARAISSQISSLIRTVATDEPNDASSARNALASGVAEQITKLASLHAAGALSSDEFTEAKRRVLERDAQ